MTLNHDRLKLCRDRRLPLWLRNWKDNPEVGNSVTASDKIYCTCRQTYLGRFMIQCDFCLERYHGSCVNISATDAIQIYKYKCRNSSEGPLG